MVVWQEEHEQRRSQILQLKDKYMAFWEQIPPYLANEPASLEWQARLQEIIMVVKLLNTGSYNGIDRATFIQNILQ